MRLADGPQTPRLVTVCAGIDHTGLMLGWALGGLWNLSTRDFVVELRLGRHSRLVGTNKMRFSREIHNLLEDEQSYIGMDQAQNPYGDGRASNRIAEILSREL